MDTVFYLIQGTLPVAIPLLLVALGGMFSERSGVINIGLEGIMLSGAFLGCLFVYFIQGTGMSPQLILLLGMIIAAVAGAIYSALLSFAAINMKADQTIVGTALNMLIPAAVLLFSKMKFGSDGVTTNVFFSSTILFLKSKTRLSYSFLISFSIRIFEADIPLIISFGFNLFCVDILGVSKSFWISEIFFLIFCLFSSAFLY